MLNNIIIIEINFFFTFIPPFSYLLFLFFINIKYIAVAINNVFNIINSAYIITTAPVLGPIITSTEPKSSSSFTPLFSVESMSNLPYSL